MKTSLRKLVRLILEVEATAPLVDAPRRDPSESRKRMMQNISRQVARRLNLSDVRFLSRSKRPQGAYTFSAVDDENQNVVLKIQPLDEIAGYIKMQQLSARLPSEVYRHLPFIKTIRTLEELGVEAYSDPILEHERLGVIVMEGLEQLPGNMFDLITEPPQKSAASLSALLGSPAAMQAVANKASDSTRKTLAKVMSDPNLLDQYLGDLKERLVSLTDKSEDLVDPDGDASDEFYKVRDAVSDIALEWYDSLNDPSLSANKGLKGTVVSLIRNDFTSALGNRAIPISPGKKSPGALSNLPGIKELQDAIEYLRNAGVRLEDVHGNNIMVRPETGDLVLSDLGHFK